MNRVAAEIAVEIGLAFENERRDAATPEQVAQDHARRSAASDADLGFAGLGHTAINRVQDDCQPAFRGRLPPNSGEV